MQCNNELRPKYKNKNLIQIFPVDNLQLIIFDNCGMGCTQSSIMLPPNVSPQFIARLNLISDVNNQFNVNAKYQHLTQIDQSKTVGQGIRKTFAFRCLTTREELVAKRKQFWETRNGGEKECWRALENVVKSKSNDEAKKFLTKARIIPLNNSIQMCIDSRGNKYELPVFVINKPLSYEEHNIAQKYLIDNYERSDVKVKIRSLMFPNHDLMLDANSETLCEEIKAMIKSKKALDHCSIRLFYNGKQLLDGKTIGNYGYIDSTIIQAMIKQ